MNGPNRFSAKHIVAHLCALIVAGYFLYAAVGKIGYNDTRQFAVEIKNYKILSPEYVNIPAIFMPWLEVAAAIALILPRTRRAGAILIGAMLLFFIAAVGYSALYLGLDISCGCTGKDSGPAGWSTIGRNVLLLLGVLAAVYLPRIRLSEPQDATISCNDCGYDLTGNASGRCPECGTTVLQCL